LSRLDHFRSRIPNLLGNMLRLDHMSPDSAAEAVRKPLEVFNQHTGAGMVVEDALVHAVLAQVRTGQVRIGETGAGRTQPGDDGERIEMPFLQLVMTRLWNEERAVASTLLRLATLERLGGAQQIVRRHFDDIMAALSADQQEVCARFFD